jgi:GT2 family glycosyltransferase
MSDWSDSIQGGISIMMPAYNASRYIAEAIESVLAQRFANWELVIVDDGSTDDTYMRACAFNDTRIRVLRQTNQGEAAARNFLLRAVRGAYVAFLDADDAYLPDHLACVDQYFRDHPQMAGVFTDGYHITGDGQRLKRLSARRRPPRTGRVFDEVVYGSDFFGPPVCVVLRRDLIAKHELRFDERILMGPDWDFFVRFSDLGPFGYIDRATCLYRVHSGSITTTLDRERRASERAKCRACAIKLPSFGTCDAHVRFNAFYDLLVVALRGAPDQQQAVLTWPQFTALPRRERGRLLRLLATEAVLLGYEPCLIHEWLRRSRAANPRDVKTAILASLFSTHPASCRALVRRRHRDGHSLDRPPFEDLGIH